MRPRDEVDGGDVLLFELALVLRISAAGQNGSVNGWMEGFHATFQHLWNAGHVCHLSDGHSHPSQILSRLPGGDQIDVKFR